ncbi:hypothetical protein Tco_1358546, partial [Tanacetum coccineum]
TIDITRAEQIALDDALVAPANRLKIVKSNDVLKLTPFYKAFQITADVLEIYMQEEMLQICPKLPDQQFEEPPFEEEIIMFLRDLGHSGEIKVIKYVIVNKLHQPWRLFAAVINKCLSGKSTGYDSLCLSQAQILWGMPRSSMFKRRLIAADQASVFMAMTSDHNRSELGIQDHSNEYSSSKLVPKVVP